MTTPTGPNPLAKMAEKLMDLIRREMPAPNIQDGTIVTVTPGSDERAARVEVLMAGAEQAIPCNWSAGFDLEIAAMDQDLVGRGVEVHFISGQPRIAYSHVAGDLGQ